MRKLKQRLKDAYKPGFGEFMGNIQRHHAKLWFAGINENWKLADYELHELVENVEDIEKYVIERIESRQVVMLEPSINNIKKAIGKKDLLKFKESFNNLTASCNSCHTSNSFEFNVITIPKNPPVTNQEFKVSH